MCRKMKVPKSCQRFGRVKNQYGNLKKWNVENNRGKLMCFMHRCYTNSCTAHSAHCIFCLILGTDEQKLFVFFGGKTINSHSTGLAEARFVAMCRFQIIYPFINISWNWLCGFWRYFLHWLRTKRRATLE